MIRKDKNTGNFIVEEQLIVDSDDGIVSVDSNDEPEGTNQRALDVKIILPPNFFEPVQINIDFPQDLVADKAVEGHVNQIEIPINIGAKKGKVMVEECLRDGRGSGIISLIRKAIFGNKDTDDYKNV